MVASNQLMRFIGIPDRLIAAAVVLFAVLLLAAVGGYWLGASRTASASSAPRAVASTTCQLPTSQVSQPNPDSGLAP